ncbi:MAG: hypothetical protein BGO31_05410 [Bacteroidetes bacterium 43-16]|uniref:RteC domain-containing protein n=1 Tax=uncultured Dysgonomonas sp. TaxID=206096 RepID=UPI0009266EF3|nr:RteC domain-containing protein [uncultured Dysgonomonas sp.]OJV52270.1 MAG: hypothetical protein BGO31_05410 [Bacteroidetes bacterium 43-16]
MTSFTEILYQQMQQSIQELATGTDTFLQRAEQGFKIAEDYLLQLRRLIKAYTFTDEAEEVLFFKTIKPLFHKELLYWSEIIRIEAARPLTDEGKPKQYIKKRLKELQGYIARNHFLYAYYKLGHSHLDKQLYLRSSVYTPLLPVDRSDMDDTFSTVAGNILAKIMAIEEVAAWLTARQDRKDTIQGEGNVTGLVWTGSKAQLIELVYALESFGVFNNGKTNVKEVMSYLQHCFKVDKVANYYGYFQGMRIRKKDRTPFLNGLIEHITRRMDEADEFPRFP